MNCQECELKLGLGEDASEHLASCVECRSLARELRLNSVALRNMRARPRMQWALTAIAAAIVVAIGIWSTRPTPRHLAITAASSATTQPALSKEHVANTVQRKRRVRKRAPAEPLRVKMFTSDPDVVIYWIVDKKEGYE